MISRTRAVSIAFTAGAVVLVPLLLLAGPAAAVWGMHYCQDAPAVTAPAGACGPGC